MIIRAARHTVRVVATCLGILLILVALLSAGARLGLPLLAGYKGEIETRVSDYLQSPVGIGELSVTWEGLGPLLRARDVAVFESDERQVTLDELLIDLNLASSLLRGTPVINELTLVGADLAIEAAPDGAFRVHGMEPVSDNSAISESGDFAGSLPDEQGVDVMQWLLSARKVGLLDARVTLIDVQADRQLIVQDLNIRAENDGSLHQLRVDLRLPSELGGTLEAGVDLIGDASALSESEGQLHISADQLRVQAISELLELAGVLERKSNTMALLDSAVSVELWGEWKNGKLRSVGGPLTTSAIVNTDSGERIVDSLRASLDYDASAETAQITINDLVMTRNDDTARVDALSVLRSSGDHPESDTWSVNAKATSLPIRLVSELGQLLLANTDMTRANTLKLASPGGQLEDMDLALTRKAGKLSLNLQAELRELTSNSFGAVPGIGPLDATVDIVDSVGDVVVSAKGMSLPWSAYSDHAINVDSLNVELNVDARNTQRIQLGGRVDLDDQGIETQTRFKARVVPGESPHLDLQSRYSATDITALKEWLPRKKMSVGAQRWIDRAIQGGQAKDGSLLLFGRLSDFPFDEGQGVFRASVDIADGQMSFLPTWPTAEGINGTLDINGLALTGTAGLLKLGDFDIPGTSARINNIAKPVLHVESTGQGAAQDIIDFGNTGPLKAFLKPALEEVTGAGAAQMDLKLTVPLYRPTPASRDAATSISASADPPAFSVDGAVFLSDNRIEFGRAGMTLESVRGAIGFTHRGLRVNNLRAQMLGHPVLVSAETTGRAKNVTTQVSITGALEGNDVLAHYGNPLDQFVRGASSWTVDLYAPHSSERMSTEGLRLNLRSDLVGTELLLPAPLYKSTGSAQSFEVSTAFITGQTSQHWDIRADDRLHVNARVDDGELVSVLMNVGADLLPENLIANAQEGIRVQGQASVLALDAWTQSISRLIDSLSQGSGEPEPVLPISAHLEIDALQLGNRRLGSARLRTNTDDVYLNTVLTNQYVSGSIRYPREHWTKDIPAKVRIEYVDLGIVEALQSTPHQVLFADDSGALDPTTLPPVDARISKVTYGRKVLHDVVMRAQPDVSGLNITTLGFAYDSMQLVGQGYWRLRDPQGVNPALSGKHQTKLELVLQADDFGQGLEYIGVKDVLSEGAGSIQMQLSWPGPAYKPELAQLDGSIKLLIERGNIVPLEPAAGRIVGLFALQALPRRLDLDFKDVTADGLAFKRITGDVSIDNGVANVELVQLTGPIGVVDVAGRSDLNRREFDQRITVLPRVSAALPIIGVLSGGATAGVGALVATGVLKALGIDLDRLGLRNYSLTGTWDSPEFNLLTTTAIRPER